MTVVFQRKSNGQLIHHEDVDHMQIEDSCLGSKGYGLHFTDNTYCLINSESFSLVSVKA